MLALCFHHFKPLSHRFSNSINNRTGVERTRCPSPSKHLTDVINSIRCTVYALMSLESSSSVEADLLFVVRLSLAAALTCFHFNVDFE